MRMTQVGAPSATDGSYKLAARFGNLGSLE